MLFDFDECLPTQHDILERSRWIAPFTGKGARGPFIAGCKLGQWAATGVGYQKNMLVCYLAPPKHMGGISAVYPDRRPHTVAISG